MASDRSPSERTLDTELFGKPVRLDYSETWLGYSLLGLRVAMAWVFLQAGLEKLFEGGVDQPLAWSSEGFLGGVEDPNPFQPLFESMASYAGIVDPLVIFGQILIGLALLLGLFFRFAAAMGGLMMLLFWLTAFSGGFAEGLPIEHGYVVTETLVYALILFGLGAWGAGRVLGLDRRLEDTEFVRNNSWARYLLG